MRVNANGYRNFNKVSSGIILLIVGLVFGAIGVFMFGGTETKTKGQELLTATIVDINSHYSGDDIDHDVIVEFDYQGTPTQAVTDFYSASMKNGQTLEGYYLGSGQFIVKSFEKDLAQYIVFAVAGILIICGIATTIKTIKYSRMMKAQDKEYAENADKYDYNEEAKGEVKQFTVVVLPNGFRPDINIVSEDGNQEYTMKFIKTGLFSNTVEFKNFNNNNSTLHKVGNVVTTTTSTNGMSTTESSFRFDGKDVFDYLHSMGMRIETEVLGGESFVKYTIKYKGRYYGTLKLAQNIFAGNITQTMRNMQQYSNNPVKYLLEMREEDLEIVALAVFAVLVSGKMLID